MWNPDKKHPSCKKVATKTSKRFWSKWYEIKRGAKACTCVGMLLITLQILVMTQVVFDVCSLDHCQHFNVVNNIPAHARLPCFDYISFSPHPFSSFGHNFSQLGHFGYNEGYLQHHTCCQTYILYNCGFLNLHIPMFYIRFERNNIFYK